MNPAREPWASGGGFCVLMYLSLYRRGAAQLPSGRNEAMEELKQTQSPAALQSVAFSEGSNHIQLLKRRNGSSPSGCGINILLCFVSVHS